MTRRLQGWSVAATVTALTVLLSGCQSSEPIGFAEDGRTTVCAARAVGDEVAFGETFSITADARVVIEDVEIEQSGVSISGIVALPPAADGSLLGSADVPLDPALWAQRTELDGAVFEGEQLVNVVVIASRDGEADGTMTDLRVAYTINGQLFADTSRATFQLKANCD